MEHSLPFNEVRPWRTTALVATAVAVIELVVLVVVGVALLGEPLSARAKDAAIERSLPRAAAKPKPKPASVQASPGAPRLARGETAVLVLNGNGRTGAAAEASTRVRAHGYLVGSTGNAPRSDYARSVVMYRAGFEAEARRFAKDLKVAIVGPLDGMAPRELMGAHVALILGAA